LWGTSSNRLLRGRLLSHWSNANNRLRIDNYCLFVSIGNCWRHKVLVAVWSFKTFLWILSLLTKTVRLFIRWVLTLLGHMWSLRLLFFLNFTCKHSLRNWSRNILDWHFSNWIIILRRYLSIGNINILLLSRLRWLLLLLILLLLRWWSISELIPSKLSLRRNRLFFYNFNSFWLSFFLLKLNLPCGFLQIITIAIQLLIKILLDVFRRL
jgi:hypothetical protein